MERISARRAFRPTAIDDFIMVQEGHCSNGSITGKDLRRIRNYLIPVVRHERGPSYFDCKIKGTARMLGQIGRRTAKNRIPSHWQYEFKKVALTVGITGKSILFKERNSKLALQHGAKHDTCQHLSLLVNTSQHTSTHVNTSQHESTPVHDTFHFVDKWVHFLRETAIKTIFG